jgi:Holliday junction resolvase RusA-like endonuclease
MDEFMVQEWFDAGRVEVISSINPVSLQSGSARKQEFKAQLGRAVSACTTGVYTGDVEVTIDWFIPEAARYTTHIVADLDNIVKPLLDAVSGPERPIINDNQVQSIHVNWLDPASEGMKLRMLLAPTMASEYARRDGLEFVAFPSGYCWPLLGLEPSSAALVVTHIAERLRHREELIKEGMPGEVVRMLMPVQRFFPEALLAGFIVRPASEYLGGSEAGGSATAK